VRVLPVFYAAHNRFDPLRNGAQVRRSEHVENGDEAEREQYYMDSRLQPVRLAPDTGRTDS
jgi:hypothetical protein